MSKELVNLSKSAEVAVSCDSGLCISHATRVVDADRELIKEIAMDIGKETVAYIEVMYPQAIAATASTFAIAVRNHIHNQIMAALEVNDAEAIRRRLDERKKFRRKWVAGYRKMRAQDAEDITRANESLNEFNRVGGATLDELKNKIEGEK